MRTVVTFEEILTQKKDTYAGTLSQLRRQATLVGESTPPAPSVWIGVEAGLSSASPGGMYCGKLLEDKQKKKL